ncbi:MAG: 4-hydroxybenzoate octaprenyltransferase, partial [Verrucomicrobiae bacterium]|nr:4-hydroxybenzoate octaprenyltransferase [Verrucomicrobiae bacterium]
VFGWIARLGWPYYLGLVGIVGCLALEHHLARQRDPVSLNLAFFRVNAVVSVLFLAATVGGVWRA